MLDEPAALKSASWGLFQIMGENYGAAGFRSVEAFVDAMLTRRSNHLLSFINFVKNTSSMKRAIQKTTGPLLPGFITARVTQRTIMMAIYDGLMNRYCYKPSIRTEVPRA